MFARQFVTFGPNTYICLCKGHTKSKFIVYVCISTEYFFTRQCEVTALDRELAADLLEAAFKQGTLLLSDILRASEHDVNFEPSGPAEDTAAVFSEDACGFQAAATLEVLVRVR